MALEHLLQTFEKLQPSVNLNFLITQFNIWSANTVNRMGTGVVVVCLLYWETKPEQNQLEIELLFMLLTHLSSLMHYLQEKVKNLASAPSSSAAATNKG